LTALALLLLNQNEFTDTEEMYNYLKIVFMKQQMKHWEKKGIKEEKKIWAAEIEKERQSKKQLFLKWLSTKEYNDKVQYKMAPKK